MPGRIGAAPVVSVTIEGVRYAPATRVGVAITTRNRREVFEQTLAQVRGHTPGAEIVVVDDASKIPVPQATWRFDAQAGIARAKNKCLEILMAQPGIEHLFILDDDIYPTADGWITPYVESAEPHLCYLFKDPDHRGRKLATPVTVYDDGATYAYGHPRGCLLYLHRSVVERVGGMRPQFGIWGNEHVEYSLRINAAGLTTNAFQDVCGSSQYLYSLDERAAENPTFSRGVDAKTRTTELARNDALLEMYRGTTDYVEYRELPNLAVTTLLTKRVDPQRGKRMAADPALVGKWLASLQGCRPVVLVDELTSTDETFVTVPTGLNPYLQRWISLYHYLRDHPAAWVWMTDGTDVEMLHAPWPHMVTGQLYVGHEPTVVSIPWMHEHHKPYSPWLDQNADLPLVNAGVVGGDHATVLEFAGAMVREIFSRGTDSVDSDMAAFNYVVHGPQWRDRAQWGPRWLTVFKANERNDWSCWRHK